MRIKLSSLLSNDHFILFIILIIAFFLRFYNYFQIPYTFDELSALNRTTYDSFSDLIKKGILNDGHPALIQVFLYYWVRIFSYSEIIVKLPFLICGIISVWLVYQIGKKWYNSTTGLLSAAFLASIQFTVMYSQIARPYATGLFFILLFVFFWTNTVIEKKNNLVTWIGFSVSASLCAYDHYFSLFSAMLIAITGLFLVSRQRLLKYVLYCFLSVILFLPHLKISIHQISLGGLNWLPVPELGFFKDYFGFIFHYSFSLILLFILLIVSGIYFHFKYSVSPLRKKLILIGLLWFILPLLTGYLYSILGKPVLQFSVLIFSMPFLFISAFSFFPSLKPKLNLLLTGLILTVTIYTLVFNRQYYNFFYNQGYDAIARNQIALLDSLNKPVSLMINGYEPFFLQYHSLKYNHEIPCDLYVFDSFNNDQIKSYVESRQTEYIAMAHVGAMPLQYFDIVQEIFPYYVKKATGSGFEWYVFSKIPQNKYSQFEKEYVNDFENFAAYWNINSNNVVKLPADSNNLCYLYKEGDEWGPEFKVSLKELNCKKHDFIHLSADVESEDLEATLVVTLKNSMDSVILWQGMNETISSGNGVWKKIKMIVRLTDTELNNDSIILQTYIWNRGKKQMYLDNFTIKTEVGNPFIYSMFYDF